MAVLYTNNAISALSASITNSATSFSITSGHGIKFPVTSGVDYFYVTLSDTAGNVEIVKVTGRSTDTFTVIRAQDGTTGLAFSASDKVELRVTKAVLDDIKTDTKGSLTLGNVTTALGFTPYNSTNPSSYITGITSGNVTAALGFTPYNATNPSNYIASGGALGSPSSGTLSSCTVDGTNAVGYINIPQNSQSTAYTTVLGDAGKHIFHPSSDANARTFTIAANSSVAYLVGTVIIFVNLSTTSITIAINSDTLTWAQGGVAGSRTLAQYGVANCLKITATQWLLTGTNVT